MPVKDARYVVRLYTWSADRFTFRFGIFHSAFHALADDISFYLAENAHHFKHSFCHWVKLFAAVYNKAAEHQFQFFLFRKLDDLTKLFCTACNSADFRRNDRITNRYGFKQFIQFRAICLCAAFIFQINRFIRCALLFKFSDLPVNILKLFICRAPCITINYCKNLFSFGLILL